MQSKKEKEEQKFNKLWFPMNDSLWCGGNPEFQSQKLGFEILVLTAFQVSILVWEILEVQFSLNRWSYVEVKKKAGEKKFKMAKTT